LGMLTAAMLCKYPVSLGRTDADKSHYRPLSIQGSPGKTALPKFHANLPDKRGHLPIITSSD